MDEQNTNPTEGQESKSFTQDDVNRIVGERLAKEKTKSDQAIQQREQELSKKELDFKAKEILSSKGLSLDILEALNYSDEESLNKSISIITQIKKKEPVMVAVRRTNNTHDSSGSDPIRKAMGL